MLKTSVGGKQKLNLLPEQTFQNVVSKETEVNQEHQILPSNPLKIMYYWNGTWKEGAVRGT